MQDERLGDGEFVDRSFVDCALVDSEFARAIKTNVVKGSTRT